MMRSQFEPLRKPIRRPTAAAIAVDHYVLSSRRCVTSSNVKRSQDPASLSSSPKWTSADGGNRFSTEVQDDTSPGTCTTFVG